MIAPDTCDQATAHAVAANCEPHNALLRAMGIEPATWLALTPHGRLRAELAWLGPRRAGL